MEAVEETKMEPDNPLMRKKKTPEELAKEAEEADLDDLTSELPVFRCFVCTLHYSSFRRWIPCWEWEGEAEEGRGRDLPWKEFPRYLARNSDGTTVIQISLVR